MKRLPKEELLDLPARATILARVKFPTGGRIPGQVVTLETDAAGMPLDDAWRSALEGGLVEIIQEAAERPEKRSSR